MDTKTLLFIGAGALVFLALALGSAGADNLGHFLGGAAEARQGQYNQDRRDYERRIEQLEQDARARTLKERQYRDCLEINGPDSLYDCSVFLR